MKRLAMADGYHASWALASAVDEIRVLIAFVFHHWQNTLSSEVHDVKLSITLKQSDADGFGGELLETLGMNRALRDTKTFVRELAVTELLDKFTDSLEEDEEDGADVAAKAGSFTGRRRRRRRTRPTDFLLYEDNSLYALPYLEPLTDRGIIPLRVSLRTDSTVALTPINASAADDAAEAAAELMKKAARLVDESIDRFKLAERGEEEKTFKFISESNKNKLTKEVASLLEKDSAGSETTVSVEDIDGLVSKMVNASSDDELATAALDLARRALLDDNVDPQVLAALKAAAFTLSNG